MADDRGAARLLTMVVSLSICLPRSGSAGMVIRSCSSLSVLMKFITLSLSSTASNCCETPTLSTVPSIVIKGFMHFVLSRSTVLAGSLVLALNNVESVVKNACCNSLVIVSVSLGAQPNIVLKELNSSLKSESFVMV